MSTATRATLLQYCERHGITAELRVTGGSKSADFWAPRGKKFEASGCKVISVYWHGGPAAEFYGQALNELQEGFAP